MIRGSSFPSIAICNPIDVNTDVVSHNLMPIKTYRSTLASNNWLFFRSNEGI